MMVHDELEDFATPIVRQFVVDEFDNDQFNEGSASEGDDDVYYNYDDEYFY